MRAFLLVCALELAAVNGAVQSGPTCDQLLTQANVVLANYGNFSSYSDQEKEIARHDLLCPTPDADSDWQGTRYRYKTGSEEGCLGLISGAHTGWTLGSDGANASLHVCPTSAVAANSCCEVAQTCKQALTPSYVNGTVEAVGNGSATHQNWYEVEGGACDIGTSVPPEVHETRCRSLNCSSDADRNLCCGPLQTCGSILWGAKQAVRSYASGKVGSVHFTRPSMAQLCGHEDFRLKKGTENGERSAIAVLETTSCQGATCDVYLASDGNYSGSDVATCCAFLSLDRLAGEVSFSGQHRFGKYWLDVTNILEFFVVSANLTKGADRMFRSDTLDWSAAAFPLLFGDSLEGGQGDGFMDVWVNQTAALTVSDNDLFNRTVSAFGPAVASIMNRNAKSNESFNCSKSGGYDETWSADNKGALRSAEIVLAAGQEVDTRLILSVNMARNKTSCCRGWVDYVNQFGCNFGFKQVQVCSMLQLGCPDRDFAMISETKAQNDWIDSEASAENSVTWGASSVANTVSDALMVADSNVSQSQSCSTLKNELQLAKTGLTAENKTKPLCYPEPKAKIRLYQHTPKTNRLSAQEYDIVVNATWAKCKAVTGATIFNVCKEFNGQYAKRSDVILFFTHPEKRQKCQAFEDRLGAEFTKRVNMSAADATEELQTEDAPCYRTAVHSAIAGVTYGPEDVSADGGDKLTPAEYMSARSNVLKECNGKGVADPPTYEISFPYCVHLSDHMIIQLTNRVVENAVNETLGTAVLKVAVPATEPPTESDKTWLTIIGVVFALLVAGGIAASYYDKKTKGKGENLRSAIGYKGGQQPGVASAEERAALFRKHMN